MSVKPRCELRIKSAENKEELRCANELMAQGQGESARFFHWLQTCGAGYPGYRPEHTRIALWKGEVVGALRIYTEVIRIGEARLRTGGIGGLTTAAAYRGHGVCRALMMDAYEYLKNHNYHVAMLFGSERLFQRFGFVPAVSTCSITVNTSEVIASHRALHRIRLAKPGDIPVLQRIHNANEEETACSLIRTSAHLTNKWERCRNLHVLTNVQGKILGYLDMKREEDEWIVHEVGVAEARHSVRLLSECGCLAAAESIPLIRFIIPPSHPFATFLLRFQGARQVVDDEIYAPGCGRDGLMAFVNLEETLENCIPEWEGALARSALRNVRIETSLCIGFRSLVIRADRGGISILTAKNRGRIAVSSTDFLQMLTGYRSADEILSSPRRLLRPEERLFLDVLFPERKPYVWPFDRF